MQSLDKQLVDKKVIVVGGAGLLGSKICEAIAGHGAKCVIADVNKQKAGDVASKVEKKYGVRPFVSEVSVVDSSSVDLMIKKSEEQMGGIDSLVNASYPKNINYGRKFEDVTYDDFCENTNLHLGGCFLVSQKILEYFKRNKGGNLLNMSSIYGVTAPRFDVYNGTTMTMPVEYAAIKSAVIHLTKYMAKYYAGNNIRVNALSLGGLLDSQPEAFLEAYRGYCIDKGMLNPEDVVGAIIFLLSDVSRYINGQNFIVDDGWSL